MKISDRSMPASIPGESALCLYRIAQEALSNIIKHSGARHARVDLGSDVPFSQLAQVFDYLHTHHIAARQIFADAGKKIVVKTAHGS